MTMIAILCKFYLTNTKCKCIFQYMFSQHIDFKYHRDTVVVNEHIMCFVHCNECERVGRGEDAEGHAWLSPATSVSV